ncbi:MAG: hypothetical protein HRU69_09280 [Flammeovirgaceae bacterium]|nr:MAG: hypothetical protein HRU69_09280 [Flammeovirgaceae bacterium]
MKPDHLAPFFLIVLFTAWAGCSSTHTTTSTIRDGSSIEKAVVVKSIREEYQWVQEHYPNSRVIGQALLKRGGKHYDELTFVTPSGDTKKAYFDINSFFGKF